ncbi:hypothetical protein BRD00_05695 [Halobacteriales archaeon QS_8_69_26]|nr:MAG: hypothetical protein BRD00_05695 [Halobacteriales archaeon QS_8_69_26]
MRRRTLLAAAAGTLGSLAGCGTGGGSDPGYEGLPADQAPDETFAPDERQRRIALEAVDPVPAAADLAIDVELLDGTVTGEDPAELAITTTNEGPERFVSVGEGGCSLFNRDRGESEDQALWLVQQGFPGMQFYAGDGPDEKRVDPLWAVRTDGDGPPPGIVFLDYGCAPRLFPPGDAVTSEYRVWDGWRGEGYMSPGLHRVETDVEVRATETPDEGDDPVPGDTVASFTWGLELRVTDPDG